MGNLASSSKIKNSYIIDMWSAIRNYDDDALQELLKRRQISQLRFSIRSCLLRFAVIRNNPKAVRLILESGYDMEKAARAGFFPLATAAEYCIFGDRLYNSEFATTACFDTMKMLLDHGAQLTYHKEVFKSNPFRFIHRLAVIAPDAVELLFENMPESDINSLCCEPGITPMSACFLYVCFYYKYSGIVDTPSLAAVFANAILPLLRYGARFGPSIFDQAWLSSRLCNSVAELNEICSVDLWGRQNVVIELLIAALQRSDFDHKQMAHVHWDMSSQSQHSTMLHFSNYIRSCFPLSLQSICRLTILKYLPIGKKRIDAISELGFPELIEDYLLFREFELSFVEYQNEKNNIIFT